MTDHSASRRADVLASEAPHLIAEPAELPRIAAYRVTYTVDTYEQSVAVLRAYIAAIGEPPRGSLVQALDERGEPLWTPPAREREREQ